MDPYDGLHCGQYARCDRWQRWATDDGLCAEVWPTDPVEVAEYSPEVLRQDVRFSRRVSDDAGEVLHCIYFENIARSSLRLFITYGDVTVSVKE